MHTIRLIGKSLLKTVKEEKKLEAHKDMAIAALLSGFCLSNSRVGRTYALFHPLEVYYKIPQTLFFVVLLTYVMGNNQPVITKKLAKIAGCLERIFLHRRKQKQPTGQ